ncbi:MAG: hypothetical protein K0R65_1732 [Crocinitomicaceae bacterium]|jgi:hypothetical protein|nr:hypothetical protein [Crocinitomicaceae bacterium]
MKTGILFVAFIVSATYSFSQILIDVTEQTILLPGHSEKEVYFAFAAGDQVVLNLKSKKKTIGQVEIIEYPSNSKFSDVDVKAVNKTMQVSQNTVFIYKFKNTSRKKRLCKIKIQRIPANESTKNYNSAVRWITKQDTTWNVYTKEVLVGHDTTYQQKSKKVLLKTEIKESLILDKTPRVHTSLNSKGNKTEVSFTIPENETSDLKTKELVSWGYWIGVNDEGSKAWNDNMKTVVSLASKVTSIVISPLGGAALGLVGNLAIPAGGDEVFYRLANKENRDLFWKDVDFKAYDKGNGTAAYKLYEKNFLDKYFIEK